VSRSQEAGNQAGENPAIGEIHRGAQVPFVPGVYERVYVGSA